MSRIRGVLFDKDGTLFHFAQTWEAWAGSFLARLSGGDSELQLRLGDSIGYDAENARLLPNSVVVAGTPDQIADALMPCMGHMARDVLFATLNEEAAKAPQVESVPLAAFLKDLRGRGLRLGVATNDTEMPARAHLDRAGITDLFDFISGFDSGHGAKPAPGQLLAFARAVGLDPSAVVMVGDSTHDLLAGRAAGMRCVGVLTGLAPAEELAPHADAVLADIGGLPAWVDAQ